MAYAGIDLGTSALKLLVVNEEGKIIKTCRRSYPLNFPAPGMSEQNPSDWWEAVKSALKEASEAIKPERITALSASGQMHGLVILDKDDRVIRPAILWNDGRTEEETKYMNTSSPGEETLSSLTGNIAFAGFTAPKLLWLKKHEPEAFNCIKKIMLPKDYLTYMLTGIHATDMSDAAGTLILDVKNRRWSEEMAEICGISQDSLPSLNEGYEAVGTVKKELAKELGLPENCVVAAGSADNAGAAIGMGVVEDSAANISLGTSGTLVVACDNFRAVKNHSLHSFCHADGSWYLMGCMLSSAASNKWWMENVQKSDDYSGMQNEISNLGNNEVYFMPYLTGERTPHNDANVRAAFVGLSAENDRSEMLQAVLEGVAFSFRDALEICRAAGINITRSKICGGGAKSPIWRKIIAAVLDLELERMDNDEGPGFGAAILAMVAQGSFKDVRTACKALIKSGKIETADKELVSLYNYRYEKYKKLYPALRDFYR